MSTPPKTYQGTNIEGIDWHGPIIDIIDELVSRRFDDSESKGDQAYEECCEWGDIVAFKFAQELHPHLVGKV